MDLEHNDPVAAFRKDNSIIEKLKRARKRYASSFTMHAVEHILNGTMAEKIFWSLKLSLSLGLAIYLSSKLFTSFFNHEVDTKTSIATQDRIQFPMVMVASSSVIDLLVNSRYNCSSIHSVSYNETMCNKLTQDCPKMLFDRISASNNASISCNALGQFVVINLDGKSYQTSTVHSLDIWIKNVSALDLPLLLLIKVPSMRPDGRIAGGAMPKAWYEYIVIDKIGHYRFPVEKTTITRLPYPYSNPSCIEQHSEDAMTKNIFRGEYGIGSCTKTCTAKSEILFCKTVSTLTRDFIRDEEYLKEKFVDQPIANVSKCLNAKREDMKDYMKKCVEKCHNPCFEQLFKTNQFYKSGGEDVMQLSFYYELRKEAYITEVPRYEVETLLSNFGGQLGLMVGMSAISLLEVLVWSTLLLVEYLCRITKSQITSSDFPVNA